MNKIFIALSFILILAVTVFAIRPVPTGFKRKLYNYKLPQQPTPVPFTYKSCGPASDPIVIATVSLTPSNPVVLGANLTITASGSTSEAITSTNLAKAAVTIAKSVFGVYIDIPCLDNVGSCTYTDLCGLLANASCPSLQTYGYDCKCPFAAQSYNIPNSQNPNPLVVSLPLPPSWLDWLTSGDYEAQATLYDNDSNILVCESIQVSLSEASIAKKK